MDEKKINAYGVQISALTEEDGGGFVAIVPELPGCMSDGETREEALCNVRDAIVSWIEAAEALGRSVPAPKAYMDHMPSGKFMTRIPKSLHAQLIQVAEMEGTSLNGLVTTLLAMGIKPGDALDARRVWHPLSHPGEVYA